MSYIGILEYVIGVIHNKDIQYYMIKKIQTVRDSAPMSVILRSQSTPNAMTTWMF